MVAFLGGVVVGGMFGILTMCIIIAGDDRDD